MRRLTSIAAHWNRENMTLSRRHFITRSAAFSIGFAGLQAALLARPARGMGMGRLIADANAGFGPLVKDPLKILNLPAGFSYSLVSRAGAKMDDGLVVPGMPDGMATFPGPDGTTILIRNHELETDSLARSPFGKFNELLKSIDRTKLYDDGIEGGTPSLGGTTTVVYDTRTKKKVREFLSLGGTNRNCAGGPTPWGTWLSCEEDDVNEGTNGSTKRHGYVFEVPADPASGLIKAEPIKAMGRFKHEAVCIDPRTGIVYLTEDRGDGLFYRYLPKNRVGKLGSLMEGGTLQALALREHAAWITHNQGTGPEVMRGKAMDVKWIDLDDIDAPKDDLRARGFAAGAASFSRGEGIWWGHDSAYFACTEGGKNHKGQIFRYVPSASEGTPDEEKNPGKLELFIEPNDSKAIENADNVTVAPWGDLIVCEDSVEPEEDPGNRLIGVTKDGTCYELARNALSGSEFAGVCFSPDGTTMFCNIQGEGVTLAVTGPWKKA
jgi:secreted PhoX family phosphatase